MKFTKTQIKTFNEVFTYEEMKRIWKAVNKLNALKDNDLLDKIGEIQRIIKD